METNKKEFWSLDSLKAFANETKEVEVLGKLMKIKRLTAKMMLNDTADSKDLFQIIERGLVEPSISKETFENIPIELATKIVEEIMKYSNLNMEKAEKN